MAPPMKSDADNSFEMGAKSTVDLAGSSIHGQRNPLSIALLFYLVTVGGILSACLRSLVSSEVATTQSLTRLLVSGAIVGFFGGGGLGFFYFRSSRAGMMASALGLVIGIVAGALALVEGKFFLELLLLGFAGSWLLIVVMLLSARFQSTHTG